MRILCVIDNLGPGGAQRQLVELSIGFKEYGYTVDFLTYHDISFYDVALTKAGISLHCIKELNYTKRLLKIRRFIRNGNYDVVVSFLEGANFICEFAGIPYRRWKLIVGERSANHKLLKSFKLRFFRWFHFFTDFVVANSYSNIKIVLKANPMLSRSKCKVIYNAVDFNIWKPAIKSLKKNSGKIKLVVIASHIYLKNLKGLISALHLLDEYELNKLHIEWYGDKITEPYYDNSLPEAKQLIKEFGLEETISFFPATKDIKKKIQDADIVGLFSLIEGLPNVICEGMACAKPVICSDISDMSIILTYDQRLLFKPYDPSSIKETLSYIIGLNDEKLMEMGLMNEKISRKMFEKTKIVSDYVKLFS